MRRSLLKRIAYLYTNKLWQMNQNRHKNDVYIHVNVNTNYDKQPDMHSEKKRPKYISPDCCQWATLKDGRKQKVTNCKRDDCPHKAVPLGGIISGASLGKRRSIANLKK